MSVRWIDYWENYGESHDSKLLKFDYLNYLILDLSTLNLGTEDLTVKGKFLFYDNKLVNF